MVLLSLSLYAGFLSFLVFALTDPARVDYIASPYQMVIGFMVLIVSIAYTVPKLRNLFLPPVPPWLPPPPSISRSPARIQENVEPGKEQPQIKE